MPNKESIEKAIGTPLCNSRSLGCCITNNKLQFLYVNEAFCSITGYSEKEILGKSISLFLDEGYFKTALKEFNYFIKNIRKPKKRWFFYCKEGARMEASIEVSRIEIDGKKYNLTIALDVTKEIQLENQLELEKERLQFALEGGQLGLWDIDFTTRKVYTNDIWWKMLGYEPIDDENVIPFYNSLIHPEDKDIISNEIRRIVKTGDRFINIELRLRTKDGNYKWIQSAGQVIEFGKRNHINRVLGTHTDITSHKESEKAILESEKKYRLLTESLPSIIWTADQDGYLNYMNRHGRAYFGKPENNLNEWKWKHSIHSSEVSIAEKSWFYGRETGTAINVLNRLKNDKGVYKWFQVLIIPQKDTSGNLKSWIGIATDVDKMIKIEESLKQSNTRLRSLINASPVAIYSLNTNGVAKDFWNPAAENLLGWKREEIIGSILPHVKEKNKEKFFKRLEQTIRDGQYQGIISRKDKLGRTKKLEITGGCIYDLDGNVSEIIVTLIDITELENSRNRLNKSLIEKETLLQEIHHRVKNNLAIVVSLLQLQVFRSENDIEKLRLTEAQNRVHSIAMVHELLYASEDFSSVDLISYYDKLINTIKDSMSVENQIIEHKLDIGISSLNINQAIPLGLLINELATNSLKYAFPNMTEDGFISLKIRRSSEQIHVTYSDNGVGFDKNTEGFKSGLGLRIIQSLLTQLESEHEMDSRNGFNLELTFKEKGSGPIARAN